MKRIIFLCLAIGCLMASAWAQVPAATPPQPVSVPAQMQAQIDSAWTDIQIAQLRLQLVIEQTLSGMEKGTYYDFSQQKFFRPPALPGSAATGLSGRGGPAAPVVHPATPPKK